MDGSDGAAGGRLDNLDYSGRHLHAPNFEGTRITDAWFLNADVSGDLEGMRLNGVLVAPLILAELERREPERVLLRAEDPEQLAQAWTMLERRAAATLTRARDLPSAAVYERVRGEWSYVETLRHLVLATDCWIRRMVFAEPRPYHQWGLAGSWLADPSTWGLDPDAAPSLDEISDVRAQRQGLVRSLIEGISEEELERTCVPPTTPGHPSEPHTVLQCLHVVLNEEWEHDHYANRDLELLGEAPRA